MTQTTHIGAGPLGAGRAPAEVDMGEAWEAGGSGAGQMEVGGRGPDGRGRDADGEGG
jgi:hypothetical protein